MARPPGLIPRNIAAFSAVIDTYHDELVAKAGTWFEKSGAEVEEAVQKVFDQMQWATENLGTTEDMALGPWLSMWPVDRNPVENNGRPIRRHCGDRWRSAAPNVLTSIQQASECPSAVGCWWRSQNREQSFSSRPT